MAVEPFALEHTAHQGALPEASYLAQLQSLHALSDAVGRAQTLEGIYEHSLDCLFRTLAVDRASILIADATSVMRFRAWRGISDDYRRFADGHSPWPPDHPDPQPVLVPDVSLDASLASLRDRILGEGIQALAFVPLLSRGVLLGKFMLYYNRPHTFTTAEIELARTVAQYVAFAIERKLTENALRESRDQLNVILQGVADGITVQHPDGALLFANDAAARFCGYPNADALLAAPLAEVLERFEIVDEAGQPVTYDRLPGRQALLGIQSPEMVLRYRARQTGDERWSVVRAAPIFNETGQVRLAVNIIHDFTEHKVAQERQHFLAAATDVLSGSLDLETTLQQVALLAVPRLADWCAVSLLEADGRLRRVAAAHVDPAKEPIVRELQQRYPDDLIGRPELLETIASGQPQLYRSVSPTVYQRAAKDPEHLRLIEALQIRSAMLVPLVSGERVLGTISLIAAESNRQFTPDDLALATELARRCALAVDNALHYRRAREAIAVRDEFLSIAAHELKTPITTLSGFAQVLLRRQQLIGSVDPVKLQQGLETIHAQSQRLTQLVNQLLDISRLESGRLTLDLTEVELSGLVRGVVDAIQQTTEQHRITVESPPRLVARADSLRLEQVLTNLITNAVKYSPNGGEIVVSLTTHEPPPAPGAPVGPPTTPSISLAVRDHGLGIPEAERARIFDRWYQVRRDGHLSSGLGLGLSISKQIVELHGGTIDATSPEDGGTCITVTLPMAASVGA